MIETEFLLLFYLTYKQQLPDDIKRRIFTFVPPSSWTSPSYYIMAQEIYHEWVTDPDEPRNNWLLDRWVTPEDVANNPDSDSDSDDADYSESDSSGISDSDSGWEADVESGSSESD